MFKKYFFAICILLLVALTTADAAAPRYKARLCNVCSFGSKAQNCVKCGKWAPSGFSQALLCGSCGFGSKDQYCVKCGKWTSSGYVDARLCINCGFGTKKDNCVKCGKWVN
ncbi:MAG: hypothetical protein ACOX0A_05000 [Thermoguttaceae bacterium]|jgi:hypothetical protein